MQRKKMKRNGTEPNGILWTERNTEPEPNGILWTCSPERGAKLPLFIGVVIYSFEG
jgi:hypothetical protein